jgi:hypothetical protein
LPDRRLIALAPDAAQDKPHHDEQPQPGCRRSARPAGAIFFSERCGYSQKTARLRANPFSPTSTSAAVATNFQGRDRVAGSL